MTKDANVVFVSNRGPISFVESNGGFETKRGAGGLAGALNDVAERLGKDAAWVAAATSEEDRKALSAGATENLESTLGYALHLLNLEPALYSGYYDTVSNRMLWFANHCLLDEVGIKEFGEDELRCWEEAYDPVNKRFSDSVCEVTDSSSLVLFQDYHLTRAPGHLREVRPSQTILHFTHSSFCGPEGMKRVAEAIYRQVIEGMLGADIAGFHVRPLVDGFLSCCEEMGASVDRSSGAVEHRDRVTWVRAYPIPIDARALAERARGEKVREWAERFSGSFEGPFVVRADRTEPSKNIVRGFEAFGLLLDRRKELRGKARFIACLYPSRQSMPEYKRYIEQIEEVVGGINDRYPESIDLYLEDDHDRTLGALLVYDALLVNSLMDGMNLVSKEGPAVNENDGSIVLSSTAGSFDELGEDAVCVEDPFDVEATADGLEAALDMPRDERRRRASILREKIANRSPDDWISRQMDDLAAVREGDKPAAPPASG